jgi:hypothetical protein
VRALTVRLSLDCCAKVGLAVAYTTAYIDLQGEN